MWKCVSCGFMEIGNLSFPPEDDCPNCNNSKGWSFSIPEKELEEQELKEELAVLKGDPKEKRKDPAKNIMQFFTWEHLPQHLQEISKPFGVLADFLCEALPGNPEKTTALRKLLEAKDCAVRAKLYKEQEVR